MEPRLPTAENWHVSLVLSLSAFVESDTASRPHMHSSALQSAEQSGQGVGSLFRDWPFLPRV